jgi:tetratricopeptide (TPR) repeat protein
MDAAGDDSGESGSERTLAGYITGFPIIGFLKVLELDQKTCTIQVHANGKNGCLYLEEGTVLDAEANGLSGEEAAIFILGWENVQLQLNDACRTKKRTVFSSLSQLALDASRRKDESSSSLQNGRSLDHGIWLVESNQFKKAHTFFSDFLKHNSANGEAWLWYSRCLGGIKSISTALARCTRLGPKTPRLLEDIRKLKQAQRQMKSSRAIRCPFCWAPLDLNAAVCHYCQAGLDIASALKQHANGQVKTDFLIEAVKRYTRILFTEGSVKILFFLCLAHCNLNQTEEALEILGAAIRANPGIKFLADQQQLVLQHVS